MESNKELVVQEINVEEIVRRFIEAQDVGESSKQTYKRNLMYFMVWYKEKGISSPTREAVLSYKQSLIERELSALTVNNRMVAVRKFFEWAESVKLYPNIARGVKGLKQGRGFKRDVLTKEQVKELLEVMKREETVEGIRNYAIVNLLVRTGLRTVEVVRANIEDIRQSSGKAVLYVQGKGRADKAEYVILTTEALEPINRYLVTRQRARGEEALFVSVSDRNRGKRLKATMISIIVKKVLREIGLDSVKYSAHSLRHTTITFALLGGATVQEAKELARHSSINTTMIYSHNIDRISSAPEEKVNEYLK